jgi:hypothetical protein
MELTGLVEHEQELGFCLRLGLGVPLAYVTHNYISTGMREKKKRIQK